MRPRDHRRVGSSSCNSSLSEAQPDSSGLGTYSFASNDSGSVVVTAETKANATVSAAITEAEAEANAEAEAVRQHEEEEAAEAVRIAEAANRSAILAQFGESMPRRNFDAGIQDMPF